MVMAYTVCSANDLARAKTMGQSLQKQVPGIKFFIGLADKIEGRFSAAEFAPFETIEVNNSFVPALQKMAAMYTITEFNCALKPFFADFIFTTHQPDKLLYFDSDLFFYNSLDEILAHFSTYSILLTPHVQQPVPADGKLPLERHMLSAGCYNGGFIGMKKGNSTTAFLTWWKSRLTDQCFINPCEGLFYDQNWLNLVPLYFKEVGVIKDEGCNVAYWNLHERQIGGDTTGTYMVNGVVPLTFYHFSGYNPADPSAISKHQNRFSLQESSSLKQLFDSYQKLLESNEYEKFSSLKCHYGKQKTPPSFFRKTLISFFSVLGYNIVKK